MHLRQPKSEDSDQKAVGWCCAAQGSDIRLGEMLHYPVLHCAVMWMVVHCGACPGSFLPSALCSFGGSSVPESRVQTCHSECCGRGRGAFQ